MDHPHLPRALVILLFILLAGIFLVGTLRSFASAQAGALSEAVSQNSQRPLGALAPTLSATLTSTTLEATFTELPALFLPSSTRTAPSVPTPSSTPAPTDTPIPEPVYITDMTGIVSLGFLLVVVILVGVTWGSRSARKKK